MEGEEGVTSTLGRTRGERQGGSTNGKGKGRGRGGRNGGAGTTARKRIFPALRQGVCTPHSSSRWLPARTVSLTPRVRRQEPLSHGLSNGRASEEGKRKWRVIMGMGEEMILDTELPEASTDKNCSAHCRRADAQRRKMHAARLVAACRAAPRSVPRGGSNQKGHA